MAKLTFRYGVMNSSKTANLLMVAYNYVSEGRHILCLKSSLDTRWNTKEGEKKGLIESRAIPNPRECELVSPTENIYSIVREYNAEVKSKYSTELSAVLVDEAQFLTKEQVKQLALVVDKLDIDVLCFGLKNTYVDGELFEGSKALLYYASSIEEIKTICAYCNEKATMNLFIRNGRAVYAGDTLAIGDVGDASVNSEAYEQVCYHHYLYPPAPIIGENNKGLSKQSYNDKFRHIISNQNPFGIYRKASEVAKLGLKFSFAPPLYSKEDALKIKYILLGDICIDLIAYNQFRTTEQKKKTQMGILNITEAVIHFVYHFFENDKATAFRLLKGASCNFIKFYDNKTELDNSFTATCKETTKNRGIIKLPNGKFAYVDPHTKSSWDFFESILTGISTQVNNIEVGFYFDEVEE